MATTQDTYNRKIITRLTERSARVVKNLSGDSGGVETIVRATKPTTRVSGSALVANDLWYNTATNTMWFWNGTYWLSVEPIVYTTAAKGSQAVGVDFPFVSLRVSGNSANAYGHFIQHWDYFMSVNGTIGASDYFVLTPRSRTASTAESNFGTASPNIDAASNFGRVIENLVLVTGSIPNTEIGINLTIGAGAPTLPANIVVSFVTRYIAP